MPCCLIGLGSNLGNRRQTLDRAAAHLDRHSQIRLLAISSWHDTTAIGGPEGQPPFLNGAVVIETSLRPHDLLRVLQKIESDLGRRRSRQWGPRTIDIDLLLYDRLVLSTPSLVLPHPRMTWRRFVLQPAAEVAGSMIHPCTGWTVLRLLDHLDKSAAYLAITGSIGVGKSQLARRLAQETSSRLIAERPSWRQLAAFYANPASQAWQTELEFLQQRARLLTAGSSGWSGRRRLTISDFWFDQSAAFGRVWLPAEQQVAFRCRWERLRKRVALPRLIVLLEAPAEQLLHRVLQRGRPCERNLSRQQLDRIQQSIVAQATQADQGPLLRLASNDSQQVFDEVLAATEAMR